MTAALTFGGWLKRRRGALGLTQRELGRLVGYAEVSLRKVEADELRPSREMAERLADALQITPEERARFVRFARDQATLDETAAALQETAELPGLPLQTKHEQSAPAANSDQTQHRLPPEDAYQPAQLRFIAAVQKVDWGDAPDVSRFQGRETELDQLQRWLNEEQCRVIAVLGMGGAGKTALATVAALRAKDQFPIVIWRSLRNAPPLAELLSQLLEVAAHEERSILPTGIEDRIVQLMEYLRGQRCLLVLDNFETVLDGARPGYYLPGFEGYGQWLRQLGEGRHQSCLIVTSREKPKELIPLAGDATPVRTLALTSLDLADGRAMLNDRGLIGSDLAWAALHRRYSGNPLALQIVAETIRELFGGDIAQFLREEVMQFGGITDLLSQQFSRLTQLEQEVMFWLAVEREPVTAGELAKNLVSRVRSAVILETLYALRQRSLVERVQSGFTLQNVVLEYLTAVLIERVCLELDRGDHVLLQRYPLLQATAKSYVRESQRNLILAPVAHHLLETRNGPQPRERVNAILARLRETQLRQPGYTAGNLVNLLVHLGLDLRSQDFSRLAVWQADLRDIDARDVDFRAADLARCVFTDTFSPIFSVAISPDGERLAAGTMRSEIRTWRVWDGQPVAAWVAHAGWVLSVSYSPDGSVLASGASGGSLRLWNAADARHLATMQGHTADVNSVCFSSDGSVLASASDDQTLRLWDRYSGACLLVFKGHRGSVAQVCISADGNMLASASDDQTIRIWDRFTGACLHVLKGHAGSVRTVCISPDGN